MDLAKKLGTALASLFVAVVLWLVVHNLDRSSYRFTVPVTYAPRPDDTLVIGAYPATVELQVLATKPKLRTLQASDFDVRVPNPQGRTGPTLVLLDEDDVEAPFGVVVQQVIPSQFTVTYDKRVTRTVPVRVLVEGLPAPGYEVAPDGTTSVPSDVRLTGPSTLLHDELSVATEPVDVSGATGTVGPARVALLPPAPELALEAIAQVAATVAVRPREGKRTFDQVVVEVVRGAWLTSPPNPRQLRVTVDGPEPTLLALDPAALALRVDARGLEPRTEDYFLEVTAEVDPTACPACRVTTLSQSKVHVNVKRLPAPDLARPTPTEATPPAADGAAAPGDGPTTTGRAPLAPRSGARRG